MDEPRERPVFRKEARRRFDFLTGEGFVAHSEEDHRLLYSAADFAVEVIYDDHEGRIRTIIDAHVDDRNVWAGLSCLYFEAGLGPAQRVHEIARSGHSMRAALESQASALREVLPSLKQARGASLLLRCHGR